MTNHPPARNSTHGERGRHARRLTLANLEEGLRERWLGTRGVVDGEVALGNVVVDSREVTPGDVFWALPGQTRDGADFADEAFARGAVAVVTSSDRVTAPGGRVVVLVDDSLSALWQAARWTRSRFRGLVVAVTGSVGKTTTREMVHHLVGAKLHGRSSVRNFNNHVGLPLSMLAWDRDDDYAVVELGASAPGEIAKLAELCQPHIGVLTRVGDAHLGSFGGRQALARSKAELLAALADDGLAIINGDDLALCRAARRATCKTITFGRAGECDISASQVCYENGELSFSVAGQALRAHVWGRHHLPAALAAVATARAMGVSWAVIRQQLATFQPVSMRCEMRQLASSTIINDAYNASPLAVRAALDLIRDFDTAGRRIVVLGDMVELGDESDSSHWQIGAEVVTRCGADLLFVCGQHARSIAAGARASGMADHRIYAYPDIDDVAHDIDQALRPGDVVLVKGSRIMRLERVVDQLTRLAASRPVTLSVDTPAADVTFARH